MQRLAAAVLSLAVLTLPASRVCAQAALRRFVLTVAENDGGHDRVPLKYAPQDATLVRSTLHQLGGVDAGDALSLVGPGPDTLAQAFGKLAERVRAARTGSSRTELVFYYSGHSDDRGILLGGHLVPYDQLRGLLEGVPADVRIAILDSCASGAFTRSKGGAHRPPFLFDTSTRVKGYAFLTSSAEDEAAQESDQIRGSFFTHYLVSGLRGAADSDADGKVTLTEAYRFSFDETLARTGATRFGAQHPAYDIQLAGTGDLVLTDLRLPSARLRLSDSLEGRVFVRDGKGALLAELRKPETRPVILALPAGAFAIELARGRQRFVAHGEAKLGQVTTLEAEDLREVWPERTAARGAATHTDTHTDTTTRFFGASLAPPYATNPRGGHGVVNHANVALLYDSPYGVEGLQLSLAVADTDGYMDGLQLAPLLTATPHLRGVQVSPLANRIKDTGRGLQLALIGNDGGYELQGGQVGMLNVGRFVRGAQLGLGLNVATAHAQGVMAGAINYADRLDGVSVGAVNTAGVVRGVQVGLVNTAGDHADVQLGVVNYARDADVSLGLVSYTENGGAHLQVSTSDLALVSLALRLDANYNYSFVAFGLHPVGGEARRGYLFGAGWGLKRPLHGDLVWLDMDLGYYILQRLSGFDDSLSNTLGQLRILPRVQLHRHFSLFAGLSVNVLVQLDAEQRFWPGFHLGTYRLTKKASDRRVLLWPGVVVGARF